MNVGNPPELHGMKIFKRGTVLCFGYKTVETVDPRKLEVYCKPSAMRRERLKWGLARGKPLSERDLQL